MHFSLDASLAGLKVRLFVNHPVDPKEGPHRTKYRELEWVNEADIKADNFDSYAPVPIIMAGSFNYFFTIDGRLNFEICLFINIIQIDSTILINSIQLIKKVENFQ